MKNETMFILLAILLGIFPFIVFIDAQDNLRVTTKQLKEISEGIQEVKSILESKNQKVTLSAYHPKSGGINSDEDPDKTATMREPIAGYTLAISDELFELGWLNKKIYINGWGVGKATDRMDNSIKGKQIDICAPSLKSAKNFGIKKDVLAVVLD